MQKLTIVANATATTKITDRVKSFEDACQVLGINGEIINATVNDALVGDVQAITAYIKLVIIAKALNEGWTPDWSNDDERKWYPWFDLEKGFVLNDVYYDCTNTDVSSRLCFKNEELGKYAGTQFLDLYKDYLTIK